MLKCYIKLEINNCGFGRVIFNLTHHTAYNKDDLYHRSLLEVPEFFKMCQNSKKSKCMKVFSCA